jgi:hypothetical protein
MIDFGTLRGQLQRRPTASAWNSIRKQLQAIPAKQAAEFHDTLRAYCEHHLAAWPESIARELPQAITKTLLTAPHPALICADRLGLSHITSDQLSAAIKHMAALAPWPLLRHINLTYCEMSHVELALLVDALRGAPLRSIAMQSNPLDRLTALITSPLAEGLHALDLFNSPLDDRHAARLASCDAMTSLKHLCLGSAGVRGETLKALAGDQLPALESLRLSGNKLTDELVAPLLGAERPALREINLGHSLLADDAALRLARVEGLAGLTTLNLWFTHITEVGAAALLTSPRMAVLRTLNLGSNRRVDADALIASLLHAEAPALRDLALNSDDIGPDEMTRLASSPLLTQLESLDLCHNPIGDAGARALASIPFTRLHSLRLQSCDIGPDGIAALMDAPWASDLLRLELAMNPLYDAGAIALAHGPCTKLDTLFLGACDITHVGYSALHDSTTLPAAIRREYKNSSHG